MESSISHMTERHASRPDVRVVKLGGSLLDLSDLRTRFRTWLEKQSSAMNLVVVGGGKMVDAIRELDRIHHLDEERVHWLCVEALSVTAALAAQILQCNLIESHAELSAVHGQKRKSEVRIVPPIYFYHPHRPFGLPTSWQTTSDAIAAALAVEVGATELVWLKSTTSEGPTVGEWMAEGLIDPAVDCLVDQLPRVRICDLRQP